MKERQPSSNKPILSVIVPTRNEADNVASLLQRLSQAVDQLAIEVVFVDDSTDETPQIIREMNGRFPFPVHLIARPPERRNGLSGAVVEGLRAVKGQWVCVIDGDLQHPPEIIPQMWQRASETGADIVVGSRRAGRLGPMGLSRLRSLTSQILTIMARAMFPRLLKNASDPLTGLFLVRRQAVDPDLLHPEGFKILLEILIRCPNLRVSEIYFAFGGRHAGESKADLNEGMRFLRHLLRLRLTANEWFLRFVFIGLLGLVLNTAVLITAVAQFGWGRLVSAVFAVEMAMAWHFFWEESWIFSHRRKEYRQPRLFNFLLTNHAYMLLLWLPLMAWLETKTHYITANLIAIAVTSLIRYILSEQWIWTQNLIVWQRELFSYDIHGVIGLESPIPLPELAYFETAVPPNHIDIQIRIDRHGTPSCPPGAICFDEKLSRFGFSLAIMPGECTEVVVSPALEKAPYALYKSIIEPLLRWTFVRKGYALIYGACVSFGGQAILIIPKTNMGKTTTTLHTLINKGGAFMSDDLTIIGRDGEVKSYPKPLTVNHRALQTANNPTLSLKERLALPIQNLLYSRKGRRIGVQFSQQHWPVATLNIYGQRFIPPPKYMIERLIPGVTYADSATLAHVVLIEQGADLEEPLAHEEAVQLLIGKNESARGFPPYAFLTDKMSRWHGQDLHPKEQAIIDEALQGCPGRRIRRSNYDWWQYLL